MLWYHYLAGNLIGILLILFVIGWFWLANPRKKAVRSEGNVIDIVVNGGVYKPSVVRIKRGKPIILRFLRKDATPCASVVVFSELNQSAELSLGKPVEIKLTPEKAGEFEFTCQMGMYRGRLIVEE